MALKEFEVYISTAVLFLTVVTVPLYIFIIIVMIRYCGSAQASSNNLYIKIVIVKGITDVLSAINCSIGSLLPSLGAFPALYLGNYGNAIARTYLLIAWSSRLIQGCSCVLLTINRSTLLISPTTYNQVTNDAIIKTLKYWKVLTY